MKSPVDVPKGSQDTIKTSLTVPQQNYGQDNYIIDLDGPEKTYWLGTESELLGSFHFDGACTAGDGSCDVTECDVSHSMGAVFCNLVSLKWLTREPPTPPPQGIRGRNNRIGWVERRMT